MDSTATKYCVNTYIDDSVAPNEKYLPMRKLFVKRNKAAASKAKKQRARRLQAKKLAA